MLANLKQFFADVKGSKPGILVPEELFRAIVTSLGSGTIIGFVVMVLQALLDHVVSIFPDPAIASLASITLTLILDLLRRQNHGDKPAGTPDTPVSPSVNPVVAPIDPVVPPVPPVVFPVPPLVPPVSPVIPPAIPVVPPVIPPVVPVILPAASVEVAAS